MNTMLKVQVIATSFEGTRTALATAQTMASGLGAHVVLFVPYVVPYGEALEHPTLKPELVGARYARLAEELSLEAEVRVCVCRSSSDVSASVLSNDAPVVVGGEMRRWFPTREQKLAASLVGKGYEVLLIGVRSPSAAAARASGGQAGAPSHTATARRWSAVGR